MPAHTFYWLDGKKEVLQGDTPEEALNKAGYGQGALKALDFYAKGDDNNYTWDPSIHEWKRKQ